MSNTNRVCAECQKSESEVVLFSIILPPEIPERTDYCRQCLSIVIDNSIMCSTS